MYKKIAFIFVLLIPLYILAETIHDSNIASNETWTVAGNPHLVTNSITVLTGAILSIDPGCIIKIFSGKAINIQGRIIAAGTSGSHITITRNGESESFSYFYLYSSSTSNQYTFCDFSYGNKGINLGDAEVTLSNCTFSNCTYGVYISEGTFTISDCDFSNNTYGIEIRNFINPLLTSGNTFSNNEFGARFYMCSDPEIQYPNSFDGNEKAIFFDSCISPEIAAENQIINNTEYGVGFANCSNLGTIDSLNVTGNLDYGSFFIQNSGDFTLGPDLILTGNNWPLSINPGSFPTSDSNIPTSGNTNNDIQIIDGSCDKIGTWHKFNDLDYYLNYNPTIADEGALTIDPGVSIYCGSSSTITTIGVFDAQGTIIDSIRFYAQDTRDNWTGLYFSNNSTGILNNCILKNAHKAVNVFYSDNVSINNTLFTENNYGVFINYGDILINSCTISENNYDGICCNNGSPDIFRNQIINNGQNGIRLSLSSIPNLGSNVTEGNTIYGNDDYDIYNGTEDINADYTWWGSDNFHLIPAMIYDSEDDALLGTVSYSSWSDPDHEHVRMPATAPDNIVINEILSQINLSWNSSIDGTYYQVYYSDDPYSNENFWQLHTTEIYDLYWSEPSVQGKRFYYICAIEEL